MTVLPNFLIIGAAKAGTSALYDILTRHPDVVGSPIKEPNFFALDGRAARFRGPGDDDTVNRLSVAVRSDYERLFEGAPRGAAVGEASTMYLSSDRAPEAIRSLAPDMRLVCVLREPISRAFSSYLHMVRDGREPQTTFRAALEDEERRIAAGWEPLWHYARLSRYHTHLSRYLAVFPRHQLHLVMYEDFRVDPARTLSGILEFLGLDPEVALDLTTTVNVSGEPRSRLVQHLLVRESVLKRLFRTVVPQRIRHRLWYRLSNLNVSSRRQSLDPDSASRLASTFAEEVEALERVWGRSLDHWRETWPGWPVSSGGGRHGADDRATR